MMPRIACFITAIAMVAVLTPASRALDVGGSLIVQYNDREGSVAGSTSLARQVNGQFDLTQMNLRLQQDLSDYNRAYASVTSTLGNVVQLNEGWLQFGGLPYEGSLTVGRFYKPLGAPLQTVGLSYNALLFHAAPVLGLKAGMEYYPWRWEAGFVNNNPLNAAGTTISGSTAFARPLVGPVGTVTNNKEGYLFLGWRDGGDWGALDVNVLGTVGEMTRQDNALVHNGNLGLTLFRLGVQDEKLRYQGEVAVDYTYGPYRVSGHYSYAKEGPLQLNVYNVTGSYRYGSFNWIAGFDQLKNNFDFRPFSFPASWNRKRVSLGCLYELTQQVQFQLEYEINREEITHRMPDASQEKGVLNDGVTLQTLVTF